MLVLGNYSLYFFARLIHYALMHRGTIAKLEQDKQMRRFLSVILGLITTGCTGLPEGVKPVEGFELGRYLGKWYEIARLDHSFERGLDKVTAEYSMRDGGGVKVVNRGYSRKKAEWDEAEGKAFFVRGSDEGYLKVSFFGPFYGSYVIFELDVENYSYAFVAGPAKSYLWFLSRTPTVGDDLVRTFVDKARELGFDTDALIMVDQT
jgi:apolipoprotein D and lipocalin family protein